jgi:hypothetical protein
MNDFRTLAGQLIMIRLFGTELDAGHRRLHPRE